MKWLLVFRPITRKAWAKTPEMKKKKAEIEKREGRKEGREKSESQRSITDDRNLFLKKDLWSLEYTK